MLRVGISVEGATEREFVNQVMIPYFSVLNVFLTPVPMNGNVSLARIRHELPALLGMTRRRVYHFTIYMGSSAVREEVLKN